MMFKLKSVKGSTIIELLIATMVVGLIVTAVANVVTYSIKNTGESRFRQTATILGQQVIEHFWGRKNAEGIIALSDTLSSGINCYSDIDNPTTGSCGPTQVITMAGTNFEREVSITKGGDGTRDDPYFINLVATVTWLDGDEARQVELIQQLMQDSAFSD